jgi:hypothetical protein
MWCEEDYSEPSPWADEATTWPSIFHKYPPKWWLRRLSISLGQSARDFDLTDARLMIASALEDLAQLLLEEGKPLPTPDPDASAPDADLIELVPVPVHAGASRT